jgi:hypothetical protein
MADARRAMTKLARRLDRLEATAGIHDAPTCIVVTDYPEEQTDVAVARYRDEHPEAPEHARFIVVVTGFNRAPGEGKEAAS